MTIKFEDMRPEEISYTHMDPETQIVRTFAVTRMLDWISKNPTKAIVYNVPSDAKFAAFIAENRGIETHRLISLIEAIMAEHYIKPLLMVKMPDDTCLIVDGNHRYLALTMTGAKSINAYILEASEWEPFIVEGVPTDMQLRILEGLAPSGLDANGNSEV